MSRLHYEVTVRAKTAETKARFLRWMEEEHRDDMLAVRDIHSCRVIDLGQTSLRCDYVFTDRAAFDAYEQNEAPQMRAKFRERFSPDELEFHRGTYLILLNS